MYIVMYILCYYLVSRPPPLASARAGAFPRASGSPPPAKVGGPQRLRDERARGGLPREDAEAVQRPPPFARKTVPV